MRTAKEKRGAKDVPTSSVLLYVEVHHAEAWIQNGL